MQNGFSVLRHLIAPGLALTTSLFAYHFAANASVGGSAEVVGAGFGELQASAVAGSYELGRLKLLNRTMGFVGDKYVEPGRVDAEVMFDAALDAAERRVPEVLFRREPGSRELHVSVGSYTTTLELAPMNDVNVMVNELERVAAVLAHRLSDEVPAPEVEYAFINGVLGTLDPHSVLMPPEAAREMNVDNAGEFGGLGININNPQGRLTIESPLPDTPADKAGLKAKDQIVRIDGESTVNMDLSEAVTKLRGPVDAPVTLTIRRESWPNDRDVTVVRAKIKVKPVDGELLDGGVGYARIQGFHATVSTDLVNLLARLRRDNDGKELKGLVLDMRGNPGGFLHQAIEVSDLFLDSGGIVSTVERGDKKVESRTASRMGTQPDYPIVVLVDASSASASEIVAGALVNNGRAVIVGERTFGKGSVQNLYRNEDDSQLKLTVAKYLTPNERSIQSVGIPADILLRPTLVDVREDEETGQSDPVVAMFFRDRVTREADLDHHMEWSDGGQGQSVYELRYLRALDDSLVAADPPVSEDWEVQFSRDVLLAAPGGANRAEVLASVGPVIATYDRQERARVSEAMASFGLDWSAGDQPATPSLSVELDLGPDGLVRAGEANEEVISVKVTNTGDEPVYQVMAVASSSYEWLDGDEFFFGHLEPGETRVWPRRVRLPEGYRSEVGRLSLTLQDGARVRLGESEHTVAVEGHALPSFSWSWSLTDVGEGTHGDGDGVAEPGEVVALEVVVQNDGDGVAMEAFAKLKNEAGRALDLQTGVAELGQLQPQERKTARFLFKVMGGEPELKVELRVGDQASYDYAAIHHAGFYDQFVYHQPLSIPVGVLMAPGSARPPSLELTRGPELRSVEARHVLTGVATDADGVRDVLIFRKTKDDEDKVYYQGGGEGVDALPFTSELELVPGDNLFVVMVRDLTGLASVLSLNVWYDAPEVTDVATALRGDADEG